MTVKDVEFGESQKARGTEYIREGALSTLDRFNATGARGWRWWATISTAGDTGACVRRSQCRWRSGDEGLVVCGSVHMRMFAGGNLSSCRPIKQHKLLLVINFQFYLISM